MKRVYIYIVCLTLSLFWMGLTAHGADINYEISQYSIDATVNSDGGMDVTEYLTCSFKDKANGIFRDIDIKNPENELYSSSSISNIEVFEGNFVDDDLKPYELGSDKNGQTGIFTIFKTQNGVRIKIYSPGDNKEKRFVIQYHLKDAVVKYRDTADLYWQFIDREWDTDLHNVTIVVSLPGSSNELRIFSHGPLSGNTSIVDTGNVQYSIDALSARTCVTLRVLFPSSFIPGDKKFTDKKMLNAILVKEGSLAAEANRQRLLNLVSHILTALLPLAAILLFLILNYRFGWLGRWFKSRRQ